MDYTRGQISDYVGQTTWELASDYKVGSAVFIIV
jgi:hypothetical protein